VSNLRPLNQLLLISVLLALRQSVALAWGVRRVWPRVTPVVCTTLCSVTGKEVLREEGLERMN
jgi:hypothetical protein